MFSTSHARLVKLLLVVLMGLQLTKAFQRPTLRPHTAVSQVTSSKSRFNSHPQMSMQLGDMPVTLLTSLLQKVPQQQAQNEFFFFFFGGSGALGIGAAQIPKLLAEFNDMKALAGGPSKGGEALQCSPIATLGFPEPLREGDIEYIIANLPTVEQIDSKGKKLTFIAKNGGLERDAFAECLPKDTNPLAMYAAFEALAKGNANFANPVDARTIMDEWKQGGVDAFAESFNSSKTIRFSAYSFFAFLLALVFDLVIESGLNAFYP